jgi:hypothetical protein
MGMRSADYCGRNKNPHPSHKPKPNSYNYMLDDVKLHRIHYTIVSSQM